MSQQSESDPLQTAARRLRALQPPGMRRPVLGLAGWSGAGKTTLLEAVIPRLRDGGLAIAVLKHAHHHVDVDQPGKDSYRLRSVGAHQVLLSSSQRRALLVERQQPGDPVLESELRWFDHALRDTCDLILVEGFRNQRLPKIEVHRPALGKPLLFPNDACILAIACNALPAASPPPDLPLLDLDQPDGVAAFILELCRIDSGH